jgi:hypothetical protein
MASLHIEGCEALSNVILAFRHFEDSRMRLGKAIQALDGGASCYDDRAKLTEDQRNAQVRAEIDRMANGHRELDAINEENARVFNIGAVPRAYHRPTDKPTDKPTDDLPITRE